MEISLRLDTLGMVETRYLRGRERYRDWPQFQLLAASRQARVLAYFNREVAEQLHQQILEVEAAVGLDVEDEDEDEREVDEHGEATREETKSTERDATTFSPAFAQALKQLNELARQRLPEGGSSASTTGEYRPEVHSDSEEDDALEQLQDAFIQMMDVVRELAEEMSTDALKITGRFKCARIDIQFIPQTSEDDDEEEVAAVEGPTIGIGDADGLLDIEVELALVMKLYEEGRSRTDDTPAVELQLDVDDFERLHETLDIALERERTSRRRR